MSQEYLLGYEWVTVVPAWLLPGVGGMQALYDAGFYEVWPLRGGGAWIRVTEHLAQYGSAAAAKLFEVVFPILPGGEPRLEAVPPYMIARGDVPILDADAAHWVH